VINLRGVIIPVVDLRERLGIAGTRDNPRTMRMIITRGALNAVGPSASRLLGLVVDSVQDVLEVAARYIEPAPESATGAGADVIAGVAKIADRLIILLDLGKVLSREERAALAEAGHVDA
jgi:purine-binding chemotaxis protein CheW